MIGTAPVMGVDRNRADPCSTTSRQRRHYVQAIVVRSKEVGLLIRAQSATSAGAAPAATRHPPKPGPNSRQRRRQRRRREQIGRRPDAHIWWSKKWGRSSARPRVAFPTAGPPVRISGRILAFLPGSRRQECMFRHVVVSVHGDGTHTGNSSLGPARREFECLALSGANRRSFKTCEEGASVAFESRRQDRCVAASAHGFLSLKLDCHAHSRVVETLTSGRT